MGVNDPFQVPAYEVFEFLTKAHPYVVVIFVINEGERIKNQLLLMKKLKSKIDIVIADGGSSDGSLEHNFLKMCGVNTLIVKTGAGKLSAQMRMAFDFAIKRGYDGVVTIDGNNKDGVESIEQFIQALDEGFDHLQGSRFIPGGFELDTPLIRYWGIRLIHAPLIRLAAGFRYTDTTNGFRAYSRRLLSDDSLQIFRDIFSTYELHYYLAIESVRKGYRVKEIPVSRVYPPDMKTPTKISPIKGNLMILKILFKAVFGCYRPVVK